MEFNLEFRQGSTGSCSPWHLTAADNEGLLNDLIVTDDMSYYVRHINDIYRIDQGMNEFIDFVDTLEKGTEDETRLFSNEMAEEILNNAFNNYYGAFKFRKCVDINDFINDLKAAKQRRNERDKDTL